MYKLPLPPVQSTDVYLDSVRTIRDPDRQLAFVNAMGIVRTGCEIYDVLAESDRLDQANEAVFSVNCLEVGAMAGLYDKQFTRGARPKMIRDSIRNSAENGLCPYCGRGTVTQLDHYLPKSAFAATTVHPPNLVPACSDCNKAKQDYKPSPADPAVLHPYFDSAFTTPWLAAWVRDGGLGTPVATFGVELEEPDDKLKARLTRHMDVFRLWERFGVWAAQILDNFDMYLNSPGGKEMSLKEVQKHFYRLEVQQAGGRPNSCDGAVFRAMSTSDWYLRDYLGLQ